MESAKVSCSIRKVKKKQVKDELDSIKQAEKKNRRLEKALAASAAICFELEKKKLKKQEEIQRLDKEGAAIAEAVALQVLLDDDFGDTCNMKEDHGFQPWDCASKYDLFIGGKNTFVPTQDFLRYSPEGTVQFANAHRYEYMWNNCGNNGTVPSQPIESDFYMPYSRDRYWETADISAIAAQAVSSLRIAENEYADSFMFNRRLRG